MMANDLQSFQRTIARALIALCFAHVPVLLTVAALRGRNFVAIAGLALLLAAVPAVFYRLRRPIVAVALLLGIALVGQTSLLVYTMRGHAWQVEMHFYYFAVLAFLLGLCDWRVIVSTAALIAMHHLSLNTVLPAAIYPSGTDFGRAAVHAIVVAAETAMLVVICLALRNAFGRAEATRQTAEQAAADLAQAGAQRETMLTETTARAEDMRALLERFEGEMSSSIDTLHAAAEALLGSANHLGLSSERASAQAVAVSTAADDTARKVELAAQGGEELAATINDIGTSAAQSSKLAATVVREAEQTNATIQEMAVVADEIGDVTSLITGIAAQTNLLALNATIEAARAGEAGRGFSVVAQEVKALSGQTARATQEIATRIAALQGATGRSVAAIGAISARIRELDSVAASMAEAVGHQAVATVDIAANVASASNGVGDVEKAIGEIESLVGANTRSVGQMSDAAHQIVSQTKTIRERVRLFTRDVARMRA